MLGSGDPLLVAQLEQIQAEFPDRFRFVNGYDAGLSHRIEAGADAFLMPSIFEPCGLNQIYSLRYGTAESVFLMRLLVVFASFVTQSAGEGV